MERGLEGCVRVLQVTERWREGEEVGVHPGQKLHKGSNVKG
jgi:hypothetical protein